MEHGRLSAADRAFFRLVAEAAFTNPFSDERDEADRRIAGVDASVPPDQRLKQVLAVVAARIERLRRSRGAEAFRAGAEDAMPLALALLFDAFHRHAVDFDRLIDAQIAAGDEPVKVPFAGRALSLLESRGFPGPRGRHFFSIFYQLRRAFYLIARNLPGRSPCMRDVRRRLWDNLFTRDILRYERYLWNRLEDFSTLLLGETGTGKGAAAAALGRAGFIPFDENAGRFAESFTRTFIALNLSQFPPMLIESELFGHRKGAFTGAVEHHEGVLARCSPHGAIFLDEIGEVAPTIQVKLLQVLQERTFTPVGSHDRLRFRGRVIAATNRPLAALRAGGQFRDDFYYRLCSDVITLPPLRQRLAEDARELEEILGALLARMVGPAGRELADDVAARLRRAPGADYAWPGNVRELEQAVRRTLLTGAYETPAAPAAPAAAAGIFAPAEAGAWSASELLAAYCGHLYETLGSLEAAARRAGLDRRTLRKYLSKREDSRS